MNSMDQPMNQNAVCRNRCNAVTLSRLGTTPLVAAVTRAINAINAIKHPLQPRRVSILQKLH
jgi:hypothetical protein